MKIVSEKRKKIQFADPVLFLPPLSGSILITLHSQTANLEVFQFLAASSIFLKLYFLLTF